MPLLLKFFPLLALIVLLPVMAKRLKNYRQFTLGVATLAIGLVLTSMIGTTTEMLLPGITGIVVGAIAGALLGKLVFAVLRSIGIVAGGENAFGQWKLIVGGSLVGVITGTTSLMLGGFGIQATYFFLVSPFIWVPIILASIVLMRRVLQQQHPAPTAMSKAFPGSALKKH